MRDDATWDRVEGQLLRDATLADAADAFAEACDTAEVDDLERHLHEAGDAAGGEGWVAAHVLWDGVMHVLEESHVGTDWPAPGWTWRALALLRNVADAGLRRHARYGPAGETA
jgi:hypothetical protein